MKDSTLKTALVVLAIALLLAEFAVHHSKRLSTGFHIALLISMLLWIWYAGWQDLNRWALVAFNNLAVGTIMFGMFLREAGHRPLGTLHYLLGCCAVLTYAATFWILFGPERFRREPKPKPPFSLLGH